MEKKRSAQTGRIGNRPYWVLNIANVVRGIHQVGGAVFLTSFLINDFDLPRLYSVMVFSSGLLLFFLEGMRHRQIIRELSGLSTMVKLLLLGAACHGYLPPAPTVLIVFFAASMVSHAPKYIRHRLIL